MEFNKLNRNEIIALLKTVDPHRLEEMANKDEISEDDYMKFFPLVHDFVEWESDPEYYEHYEKDELLQLYLMLRDNSEDEDDRIIMEVSIQADAYIRLTMTDGEEVDLKVDFITNVDGLGEEDCCQIEYMSDDGAEYEEYECAMSADEVNKLVSKANDMADEAVRKYKIVRK